VYNAAAGEIAAVPEASAEDKKKAEEFKTKGNSFVKEQKYAEAIEAYTKAIELDKNSPVYYCNRAAAYTNSEKFHEALDDCKRAIAINEDYAKAFSRMGLIYSKLQFFSESVSCYETAIKLEPDNEGYKKNLEIVKEKETEQQKDPNAMMQQAGFDAGMAGAAGGAPNSMPAGMMDAYSEFAKNPQFQEMADKVMSNPNMKSMVDNFMGSMGLPKPSEAPEGQGASNPMEAMAGMMGNGMNMNDLMALGQQFASHLQSENPEMIEQLKNDFGSMGLPGMPKPDEKK